MGQALVIGNNKKIFLYRKLCSDTEHELISSYLKKIAVQLEYSDNLEVYEIDDFTFISLIIMGEEAKTEFLTRVNEYSIFTIPKYIKEELDFMEKNIKRVSMQLGNDEVLLKILSGDIEFLKQEIKIKKKSNKGEENKQRNIIYNKLDNTYKFHRNESYQVLKNLIKESVEIEFEGCFVPEKIKINSKKEIELRYYQKDAFNLLISRVKGLIVMPIATGKNYIAINLINEIKKRTLILCEGNAECIKWYTDLNGLLEFEECSISIMDKNNIKYSEIIICNYDLIRRNKKVFEFLRSYDWGIIFYDNAHKAVTPKTIDVLYIKSEHKYALASTINRSDSKENELIKIFRSAMYNIKPQELVQKLYLKNLIYKKREVSELNKEQYIRGVIDKNSDKSILVVGHSVKSMKSIAENLGVMLINKDTNQNERNEIVDSFNNKKEKVVCCSNLIERYGFTDIDIMIDIGYRGRTPIEDHFRVGTLISTINQLDKKTDAFKYYLIGNELERSQVENKVRFLKEFIVCSYDEEGGIGD